MTPKKSNPYQELDIRPGEDHPLDTIAQSQIPTALLDNIQVATKQLLQRLSTDHRPWLDLEALLNEYRQQREEKLFNLGYENGFTAMLSRLRPHPPVLVELDSLRFTASKNRKYFRKVAVPQRHQSPKRFLDSPCYHRDLSCFFQISR
jgi:hypothetical protein